MHAAAIAFALYPVLALAQTCAVKTDVDYTFYTYDSNGDSSEVAYNCGGRNYVAGGTGTYDDPLTFASSPDEYTVCEIIYSPYLKKYLRMEDECDACSSDWDNGIAHIDVWIGNAPDSCADDLTPASGQYVVANPADNLSVDSTTLYSGSCKTGDTYLNAVGSCSSTGTGTTCQTGCTWAGHCIGCACVTYDDCSDDYVCTNGLCAAL
ncbi:hypothetical protein BX600DRAFT_517088 [Xylariales sp. PMI_506]|nr:hypothetical protein BX600DRAFT_517088 [Xylariales sp. PMI_506]